MRATRFENWKCEIRKWKTLRLAALAITVAITASTFGQQKPEAPSGARDDLLWKKLSDRVAEIVERFDGVMGVAIVDLTDGRAILKNADRVFPTASSIKIAILLELYHQDQEARAGTAGKAKLDDVYTFDPKTGLKTVRSWQVLLRV